MEFQPSTLESMTLAKHKGVHFCWIKDTYLLLQWNPARVFMGLVEKIAEKKQASKDSSCIIS